MTLSDTLQSLPIAPLLPRIATTLTHERNAVIEAPPGAGKSTGVPLVLRDAPWLEERKVLVLEPRRLAARAVATRMASLLAEPVGRTVGYRTRLDTRVGRETRIEVVTEGILTRMLQSDPALEGVGVVIFDEFHERSLHADLGLAFCLDTQANLREDLRLLVMSATLDGAAVAQLLGGATVLRAEGRSFPVDTHHLGRASPETLVRDVTNAVHRACSEASGDLLVFLPGAPEIRRVQRALAEERPVAGARVLPLYGDLAPAEQDAALTPDAGGARRIILSTSIAETSLTLEGIHVVVDAGFTRRARFDPVSGMSRLETTRVSRAAADQRRGRAGRLGPGHCYRLWREEDERSMAAQMPPEILDADLAPLALELACWGALDATGLRLLDAPPAATFAQARELLVELGALAGDGRITAHGRAMAGLGAHPRLAHLLIQGQRRGSGALAADIAAVLSERDLLRGPGAARDVDLRLRLDALRTGHCAIADASVDRGARERMRRAAGRWRQQLGIAADAAADSGEAGALLALAYPDRIGRARGADRRYLLSGGRGAVIAEPQLVSQSEFIVAAELDAGAREARVFLAAPVSREVLERGFADRIRRETRIEWDSREQAVLAMESERLGALVLAERRLPDPDPARVVAALVAGIRELGLGALPWTAAATALLQRLVFARRVEPDASPAWPDPGETALLDSLEGWLAPWLDGLTRREHLARLDLVAALRARLDPAQGRRLDGLAPSHIEVPSGSRIAIDYTDPAAPSLAVRLQEVFGLLETPRIGGGRVPLTLTLLSPAQRPVQVTRDLRSFWERGYAEVRRELKGRYPKHYWPDDPFTATATRRVRPR
ncbi:MAG: ATP-dependent helicase HrpB [Steroidobacteraceae bacterium]